MINSRSEKLSLGCSNVKRSADILRLFAYTSASTLLSISSKRQHMTSRAGPRLPGLVHHILLLLLHTSTLTQFSHKLGSAASSPRGEARMEEAQKKKDEKAKSQRPVDVTGHVLITVQQLGAVTD